MGKNLPLRNLRTSDQQRRDTPKFAMACGIDFATDPLLAGGIVSSNRQALPEFSPF